MEDTSIGLYLANSIDIARVVHNLLVLRTVRIASSIIGAINIILKVIYTFLMKNKRDLLISITMPSSAFYNAHSDARVARDFP